jgi:hypothetical protein
VCVLRDVFQKKGRVKSPNYLFAICPKGESQHREKGSPQETGKVEKLFGFFRPSLLTHDDAKDPRASEQVKWQGTSVVFKFFGAMPFEAATSTDASAALEAVRQSAERHASKWMRVAAAAHLGLLTRKRSAWKDRVDTVVNVINVANEMPYWQQCDEELDTKAAWEARAALRTHPLVVQKLDAWWQCALRSIRSGGGNAAAKDRIDRAAYFRLSRLLHKAMIEEWDEADADRCATDDWAVDSAGKNYVERTRFQDCIFELADIWTRTIDAEEYSGFLQRLLDDVATSADGSAYFWRDEAETKYGGYVERGGEQAMKGADSAGSAGAHQKKGGQGGGVKHAGGEAPAAAIDSEREGAGDKREGRGKKRAGQRKISRSERLQTGGTRQGGAKRQGSSIALGEGAQDGEGQHDGSGPARGQSKRPNQTSVASRLPPVQRSTTSPVHQESSAPAQRLPKTARGGAGESRTPLRGHQQGGKRDGWLPAGAAADGSYVKGSLDGGTDREREVEWTLHESWKYAGGAHTLDERGAYLDWGDREAPHASLQTGQGGGRRKESPTKLPMLPPSSS